jgi:hypothetical protein
MLLLAIHFLLFAPSAYFLQTKPVQPDLIHVAMLMPHVDIALGACFVVMNFLPINSIRVYGWKGLDFYTYDPDTGRITSEVDYLVSVCIALLRLVAIWYTTAWTYLCCIVLSHSVDILTRKGASPTYCSLGVLCISLVMHLLMVDPCRAFYPDDWIRVLRAAS